MTADAGGVGAPRFDVVLRGYDRRQVDEHVARLQRVVSRMRADLEMVRSQPIPVVQAPPPGFGGPGPGQPPGGRPRPTPRPRPDEPDMIGSFTDRMQSILQAAEEEAAEIRNKARAGARAESESVRAELADLVRQRDAVLTELTRLRGQLEGLLGAPTARMAVAPRPAQPSGAGGPKPGQPAGPAAAGPTKPRPTPSPAGPPKPAGPPQTGPPQTSPPQTSQPQTQQSKPAQPQPASAQAGPLRPGGTAPPAKPAPQLPAQQQPTTQQPTTQQPAAPRPVSAQPLSGPASSKSPQAKSPQAKSPQSAIPQSAIPQSAIPQPVSQQPSGQQSAGTAPAQKPPSATSGDMGQNGSSSNGQNGSSPQNGAARGPGTPPASSGARAGEARPPAVDPGKAAHRLPTGAYPAVPGDQPSMRPRSEPEPEPGELFRPQASQSRDGKPAVAEKPGRPAQKPGDVEATVKVGLVRPAAQSDRTVLSPTVRPAPEKKDTGKDTKQSSTHPDGDGSAGPGHPDRSTSTSRSG